MTILINSVSDLLSYSKELNRSSDAEFWWRGQSCDSYNLIAGIYRGDRGERAEQNLILRFRQYALTRYNKCPSHDDYCSWLFLAQHYGIPTRLLDWSESPLVALFFSVEKNFDKDANLFSLNPRNMNKIVNNDSTLTLTSSSPARQLFEGAFNDKINEDKNISILSHEIDSRMLAQQAVFTIHGNNKNIQKISGFENIVSTVKIPKESKINIYSELLNLGIRRRTLFPDLDNLAKDLNKLVFSSA